MSKSPHTIGCTTDPQNCHGMCQCDCHYGEATPTPSITNIDDELNRIFNRLADKIDLNREAYSLEYAKDATSTLLANKIKEAVLKARDEGMREYHALTDIDRYDGLSPHQAGILLKYHQEAVTQLAKLAPPQLTNQYKGESDDN